MLSTGMPVREKIEVGLERNMLSQDVVLTEASVNHSGRAEASCRAEPHWVTHIHHTATNEGSKTWARHFPLAKESSIHGKEFTSKQLRENTSSSRRNEFLYSEQGSGILITLYTHQPQLLSKISTLRLKTLPLNSNLSLVLSKNKRLLLGRTITYVIDAVLDTIADTHLPVFLCNFSYIHSYLLKYASRLPSEVNENVMPKSSDLLVWLWLLCFVYFLMILGKEVPTCVPVGHLDATCFHPCSIL